ncbi:hypothetical protein ACWDG1_09275 [Streptomyces sp. NPDC001177]
MRHHTTIGLLAAALLLTSCSTSSHDDAKPKNTKPSLADTWTTKLKDAADADTGICNQAGEKACADHLTDVALVVGDLEDAINTAGATRYPRTTAEIDKVNTAVQAYTDHECLNDENASIQGSPCPDDARTIMTGAETLQSTLVADEAKAG